MVGQTSPMGYSPALQTGVINLATCQSRLGPGGDSGSSST